MRTVRTMGKSEFKRMGSLLAALFRANEEAAAAGSSPEFLALGKIARPQRRTAHGLARPEIWKPIHWSSAGMTVSTMTVSTTEWSMNETLGWTGNPDITPPHILMEMMSDPDWEPASDVIVEQYLLLRKRDPLEACRLLREARKRQAKEARAYLGLPDTPEEPDEGGSGG